MGEPPASVFLGANEQPTAANWQALLAAATQRSSATWEDEEWNIWQQVTIIPSSELVNCRFPDGFSSLDGALALFEPFPSSIASFDSPFTYAWIEAEKRRWGFGRSMIDHRWECAFRGASHDRLVSRRWLDFGPWRVIRRPNDTTFIQFHDLALTDPEEAYAQPAPGHERMGNSKIGGFIQHGIDALLGQTRGLYIPEERKLEIVVGPGNRVEQFAMHCACAERLHSRLTRPSTERIDTAAYIFVDRGDAEAHLHELWLRELECWYMDERGKHRLDADYNPTPNPPAWVRALDASTS